MPSFSYVVRVPLALEDAYAWVRQRFGQLGYVVTKERPPSSVNFDSRGIPLGLAYHDYKMVHGLMCVLRPGLSPDETQVDCTFSISAMKSMFISDESKRMWSGFADSLAAVPQGKQRAAVGGGNAGSPPSGGLDELERLHGLMTKGIITPEEFEQKRKKILGL